MEQITQQQYEYALLRIEELLPVVNDEMARNDRRVIELSLMSEIVIAYEKFYYPIEKPAEATVETFA